MATERARTGTQPPPYASRVSEEVHEAMGLVGDSIELISDLKAREGSDRRVVYRGLQLVLRAAEKDQPKLIRDYNARLQAQMNSGASLTNPSESPSTAEKLLRAEAAPYEVPTGNKGIQCDVDAAMDKQLQLVGLWTGRDKSELVRHGLYLVFDETRRKATVFEKKLLEDFEAGQKILKAIKKDPSFGNAAANTPQTARRTPAPSTARDAANTQPPARKRSAKAAPDDAPEVKARSRRANTKTGV